MDNGSNPTYPSSALLAETIHFPDDATWFVIEHEATITGGASACFKNGEDVSASVLSGSDTSSTSLHTTKTLTPRSVDVGDYLMLELTCTKQGKEVVDRLMLYVPDYSEGPFSDEPYVMFAQRADGTKGSSEPLVFVWNSAARLTAASSRVYKDGQDVSATRLSGSDSYSGNVHTGKTLAPLFEDAGSELIYEWRGSFEGRVFNARRKIIVPELEY